MQQPHRRLIGSVLALTLLVGVSAADAQTVDVFNPGANGEILAVALQADGKILVGGSFTAVGGGTATTARAFIARLNVDGTVDATFDPGANSVVRAIVVQPDSKIVVAGSFTTLGGGGTGVTTRLRIGRLNADGTIDATFDPGANNHVVTMLQQPDGKILVGGSFTMLGGGTGTTPRAHLGRLNPDGTVDGFDPGADSIVTSFALQPDGFLLVGGVFSSIGGGGTGVAARNFLARLDPSGVADAFNPGGNNTVLTVRLDAVGRILVGGLFTTIGGGGPGSTVRQRVARLFADGSVDPGFDPGANGEVRTFALQADGHIIAGGAFSTFGNSGTAASAGLARVTSLGGLDTSFAPGAAGAVSALAIQPDARVLVGGAFAGVGGGTGTTPRANIARVLNTTVAAQNIQVSSNGQIVTWTRGGAAPEVDEARFEASFDGINYTFIGAGTRGVGGTWQLPGQSFGFDSPALRIRVTGLYSTGHQSGSGSIIQVVAPRMGALLNANFSFTGPSTQWAKFATPDMSYMIWNDEGTKFRYYRVAPPVGTSNQAVLFQSTGMPVPAGGGVTASFGLGNSDSVRKRITVIVHDADFSDLQMCTFWLAPGSVGNYGILSYATKAWTNATLSFYAASTGSTSGGFYEIDYAAMSYSAGPNGLTTCVDPSTPAPPGGAAGPNLLVNGDFGSGALAPGWSPFGTIQTQVVGNVLEFIRPAGNPAGGIIQATGSAITANQLLTARFQLGNSSSVRKRVTAILHDLTFGDLAACTFWVPPGQPLLDYEVRTFATQAWANASLSIYPSTVGAESWIRMDNVSLQRTPATPIPGTACIDPGPVSGGDQMGGGQ